jgi:flagellar M-ring protein FliF
MNFFQKLNAVWQKIGVVQRALLLAVVLAFVIAGGLLTRWARRPDMRLLYQELAPEEASKITEKINEQNIPYELRSGGTSIYVPKEKVYQLRLDMAKEGLPIGSQGGYKIFDKEKIGVSPFVQNVNLKRALQDELAKSIQMVDGVVHARVHIVTTEQTLFTSEAGKTTASVVLQLRPGYQVSSFNIAAITHLVAGSVEGLKPETVTVIDSQGRLLSSKSDDVMASGAGTVADYKERVEQNLAQKVEDMLTAVLGPDRASVKVSAVIDMTSINTITETPIKGMAKKEEIKSENETKPGTAGGENAQAIPGGTKRGETVTTEYEHGRTREQRVVLPGAIKSLKVAAVVDLDVEVVTEASGEQAETTTQTTKIMQLADVQTLIENALGLNLTGGDSLKVVEAKFNRPTTLLTKEEPSSWPRYIAIARQASLGIMAICALLVFKMFKGAKKKVSAEAPAGQLPAGEGSVGLLPAGAGGSEPLALRRQITSALQNNPDRARQLFNSWIEEKG